MLYPKTVILFLVGSKHSCQFLSIFSKIEQQIYLSAQKAIFLEELFSFNRFIYFGFDSHLSAITHNWRIDSITSRQASSRLLMRPL